MLLGAVSFLVGMVPGCLVHFDDWPSAAAGEGGQESSDKTDATGGKTASSGGVISAPDGGGAGGPDAGSSESGAGGAISVVVAAGGGGNMALGGAGGNVAGGGAGGALGGGGSGGTCLLAPAGIVAWWTGDDTFADAVGGHDATQTEGSVVFAGGMVGRAFNFTEQAYLDVPDSPSLALTGDFSIEAWIRMRVPTVSDQEGGRRIVSKVTGGLEDGYLFDVGPHTTQVLRLSADRAAAQGSVDLPFDVWVHVAGVVNGTSLKTFINGALDASATRPGGPAPSNAHSLRIAASQEAGARFSGLIDELTIYGRALSELEIAAIHAAGAAGKCRP